MISDSIWVGNADFFCVLVGIFLVQDFGESVTEPRIFLNLLFWNMRF